MDTCNERERLIALLDKRGEFVTDVDGFVYYASFGSGHLSATTLRTIANELDRRNAQWEATIQNNPAIGAPALGPNGECPVCGSVPCKPGCEDGTEVL